ncbi:hypothetical protein [Pseudomonas sp. GL-B-16]|uniref:hypothetical protein n=1 Tax=Pseudomonas sp. GL-B-16 TaxID=2832373 RepID=UPI001CC08C24|nr:hypothetical protein [Pseudomonas sp. GL-B-16]
MMLRVVLGLVGVWYSLSCFADLRPQSVGQICSVLNDTQLRAGEWTKHKGGHEGCTSGSRRIRPDSLDGNKISFAADGVGEAPNRVELRLNVILPSDVDAAKRELLRATKRLSVRALGLSIPHMFDEAIMNGVPISLDVGSGRASLSQTVINNQSYVLSVVME